MFIVLNMETGDFYSESPALKREAERAGLLWQNWSILPSFARPYARHRDAMKRSQRLSDATHCVCAVVRLADFKA